LFFFLESSSTIPKYHRSSELSRRKYGDRDENTLLELRAINGGNEPKRNGKHTAAKGLNMAMPHGFGKKAE
jgi:hypothetical protein